MATQIYVSIEELLPICEKASKYMDYICKQPKNFKEIERTKPIRQLIEDIEITAIYYRNKSIMIDLRDLSRLLQYNKEIPEIHSKIEPNTQYTLKRQFWNQTSPSVYEPIHKRYTLDSDD